MGAFLFCVDVWRLFLNRCGRCFALTEGDTSASQIIGRHFHGHAISQQNTNIVLAHFSREVCQYNMSIIQLDTELCSREGFDYNTFCTNFIFFFRHTSSFYSPSLVKLRRLIRRIAFFFSMRRCSLLETNQRLRRTVLKTPLLTTFLRKRLSRESCDSPLRKFTTANEIHLLPHGRSRQNKTGRYADSAGEDCSERNGKMIRDQ
jgi:hypothetical protein